MISTTSTYKNQMKKTVRNRGYMKVHLDVVNQDAQENAVTTTTPCYYSSTTNVFDRAEVPKVYCCTDKGTIKVARDSSEQFLFPPESSSGLDYVETCWTGAAFQSSSTCNFVIRVSEDGVYQTFSCKGLTIDFGENYAVNFTISTNTGVTYTYTGNTQRVWSTSDVFEDVNTITIGISKRKISGCRMRIYSVSLGYDLTYTNDKIMDSDYSSTASKTTEELPQVDFSVTLANYDEYFDIEDPLSVIHFLETGQSLEISYGYQIGEEAELEDDMDSTPIIEWLDVAKLEISGWELQGKEMILQAQDCLRNEDGSYEKGYVSRNSSGNPVNRSLYNMLIDVLDDAGIDYADWYIDTGLKSIYSKLPVPNVSTKEAIQIIANAAGYEMSVLPGGGISIHRTPTIPSVSGLTFTITQDDILDSCTTTKDELVKNVEVVYTTIAKGTEEEDLQSMELETIKDETLCMYFSDPCVVTEVTSDIDNGIEIVGWGSWYCEVKFNYTGTQNILVRGIKWKLTTSKVVKNVNQTGSTVTWENPIIDDYSKANILANKLANYYKYSIGYDFDYRGNPELEALDIIGMVNTKDQTLVTCIEELSLNFGGAFSGHLKTRRLSDVVANA